MFESSRGGPGVPGAVGNESSAPVSALAAPSAVPSVVPGAGTPALLAGRLAGERALVEVGRADKVARRAGSRAHARALRDVDEDARVSERARRERARDASEASELATLYRRATRAGTRARLRAGIQGSAEMRALRVERVRRVTLCAGMPVLGAFALWSTAGVHAGVARLLVLDIGQPGWWVAWLVEPALMAIVAFVIVAGSTLKASGGATDWRATGIEGLALVASLALNLAGGWDASLDPVGALGAGLAHSIGPLGAAATAYLISLFVGYVAAAKPWVGARPLSEMGLVGERPSLSVPAVSGCFTPPETGPELFNTGSSFGQLTLKSETAETAVGTMITDSSSSMAGHDRDYSESENGQEQNELVTHSGQSDIVSIHMPTFPQLNPDSETAETAETAPETAETAAPTGSGSGNAEIVRSASLAHPMASVADLSRLTGLSRTTVWRHRPTATVRPTNGHKVF